MADQIRVRIHLGAMDVKDAWKRLEPRVTELERRIERRFELDAVHTTNDLDEIAGLLHDDLRQLHARLFPN